MDMQKLNLCDIEEGHKHSFEVQITEKDVDEFARISGDYSPLHLNASFAKERGFEGRIVHGAFLTSFFSRLVGMYLPGKNALLQSIRANFINPVALGSGPLKVAGIVTQISHSTLTIVIQGIISPVDSNETYVKAKMQVGFTNAEN
jgi:3-hydroxybutyryl-CoA dehydratase